MVCCSTAGNLFHAYRRQVRRDYRKPLINILNKKLLKLRDASTNFEFLNNNLFATIIGETDEKINPQDVNCTEFTPPVWDNTNQAIEADFGGAAINEVSMVTGWTTVIRKAQAMET